MRRRFALPRRHEKNAPPLSIVHEIVSVESERDAFRYGEMMYRVMIRTFDGRYATWQTPSLQELNRFVAEFNQERRPHRWVRSKSALPRRPKKKKKNLSRTLPAQKTIEVKKTKLRHRSPKKFAQTLPLESEIMELAKEAARVHITNIRKQDVASKIATVVVNSPPSSPRRVSNTTMDMKEFVSPSTSPTTTPPEEPIEALRLELKAALKRITSLENEVKVLKSKIIN